MHTAKAFAPGNTPLVLHKVQQSFVRSTNVTEFLAATVGTEGLAAPVEFTKSVSR